jgi:hypothetical protein
MLRHGTTNEWSQALRIEPGFASVGCHLKLTRYCHRDLTRPYFAHTWRGGEQTGFEPTGRCEQFFLYTPSPAEAEFDGLTAGLGKIQLCP